MQVDLTEEQLDELRGIIAETLRDMSYEIAATDNSQYRARLAARRRTIESTAQALRGLQGDPPDSSWRMARGQSDSERAWTAEIVFTEDEDQTRADARIRAADRVWHGGGRSRRNPIDPDVPAVGEELAAARALADLSHKLVDAAAHEVERFEGHPVRLHV